LDAKTVETDAVVQTGTSAVGAVNGPEGDGLAWDAVDWRQVEDDVRRLRQRIFTASHGIADWGPEEGP